MKTILVDAVNTLVLKGVGLNKEILNILEAFPNKKIVLTSADDEEHKTFGLDAVPYKVFTLKHNPNKTDPNYYRALLKEYGLNIGDVVYFEHNEEAVKSAEEVGIKTFWYDPVKKDVAELRKFLETNL